MMKNVTPYDDYLNENRPWYSNVDTKTKPLTIDGLISKLSEMVSTAEAKGGDYIFLADSGRDGANVQDLRPIRDIELPAIKFSAADENFFREVINDKGLKLSLVSPKLD